MYKLKNVQYPSKTLDVFDNIEASIVFELMDEQEELVKKEADLYLKYGSLSLSAHKFTLETYSLLYYFDGYFYKKEEVKKYLSAQSKLFNTITNDLPKAPINKEPTGKTVINHNNENIVEISREAIRNITGYSPYFIPSRDEEGKSIYVKRQDDLIKDESDLILVLGSRQIGKSMSIAEKAVEESHIPNNDILVGAFTNASTDVIKNYVSTFIKNFPEGYFVEYKSKRFIVNTKTGSKIYFRTVGDEGIEAARGLTLNTIIIDEAQLVSEYAFVEVLEPTLATSIGGKMILIGTPPKVPDGYFVESILKYKRGELEDTNFYEIKIQDQPFTTPKARKKVMNRQEEPRIQRERFCNLLSTVDQLFEFEKAEEYPKFIGGYFVLGIDPARKGDRSGYSIVYINNGMSTIVESGFVPKTFKKEWKLQAVFFKKLIKRFGIYGPVITGIDCTGIGDGVVTIFRDNGITINATIRYTSGAVKSQKDLDYRVSKTILINNTLDMISEGVVNLVDVSNKFLLDEIKYIYETESRGGLIGFTTKYFDDVMNATMVALFITGERNLLKRSIGTVIRETESTGVSTVDVIEGFGPKTKTSSVW